MIRDMVIVWRGKGLEADLLAQRFKNIVRRLGMNQRPMLMRRDTFIPPSNPDDQQLSLF